MADNAQNGAANQNNPAANGAAPQVRVLAQFIKDLSFENPSIGRLQIDPNEQPAMRIEVNVNANNVAPNIYESVILLKAQGSVKAGVLYELEIEYGAAFGIENVPEDQIEPFLLINCPQLTFPFVRRLVADITREGGFPPLLLDPIDFAGLYIQRRQQQAEQGGKTLA